MVYLIAARSRVPHGASPRTPIDFDAQRSLQPHVAHVLRLGRTGLSGEPFPVDAAAATRGALLSYGEGLASASDRLVIEMSPTGALRLVVRVNNTKGGGGIWRPVLGHRM